MEESAAVRQAAPRAGAQLQNTQLSGSSSAAVRQLQNLPEEDLSRAFACAAAIGTHTPDGGSSFLKYVNAFRRVPREHQFSKILFSAEKEEQQFCVAYAEDAIFIAFRGTQDLKDVACDLMIRKYEPINSRGAAFHRGIRHRSGCFLGLHGSEIMGGLLEEMREVPEKRIIFCGHSLGGAVAHMVLWRILMECERYDIDSLEGPLGGQGGPSWVSVAFGAPHFCDSVAAALINGKALFKWRFMNVVNRRDPVPRLLHNVAVSVAEALRNTVLLNRTSNFFRTAGFIGDILYFVSTGGERVKMDEHGMSHSSDDDYKDTIEKLKQLYPDKEPKEYHPVGSYIFLDYEISSDKPMSVKEIESTSKEIFKFLQFVQLGRDCLVDHLCSSYLKGLCKASLIQGIPPFSASEDQENFLLPDTPQPKLLGAVSKVTDDKGFLLTIRGENLLFLRRVKWNGLEINAGEILTATNKTLVIKTRPLQGSQHNESLSSGHGTLTVKTAFGHDSIPVSEAFRPEDAEGEAYVLLPKLVQTLMVMSNLDVQPRLLSATSEQLERLQRIIGFSDSRNHVPRYLSSRVLNPEGKLDPVEVNNMVTRTASFIRSVLEVRFKPYAMLKKGWVLIVGGTAAGAYVGPTGAAIGFGVGIVAWTTVFVADNFRRTYIDYVLFEEYENVLRILIYEAMLWSKLDSKGNLEKKRELEDELVKHVNGSGESFQAMLKMAASEIRFRCELKHDAFKHATEESVQKLLKRIYAIVETKRLYKEIVGERCFVGVFGQEDAGKSTFIREAIIASHGGTYPRSAALPEVGRFKHTTKATPYALENGVFLVDFPGSDGSKTYAQQWLDYTALPSFVVLLLKYEGDVKKPEIQLYKNLREHTNTKIIVAFNRVDKELDSDSIEDYSSPGFFNLLKRNAAEEFRCDEGDVFFVALKPPEEKRKYLNQISEVYGFTDFNNVVLDHVDALRGVKRSGHV